VDLAEGARSTKRGFFKHRYTEGSSRMIRMGNRSEDVHPRATSRVAAVVTATRRADRHAGLQAEHLNHARHEPAIIRFASLQFFCLIYLQKFALFSPEFPLSVPMLIMFATISWQIFAGRLVIVADRMGLFLLFCGFCLFSEVLNQGSPASICYLILLYICMTTCTNLSAEAYRQILDRFIMFMILPALIVLTQYFYQKLTGLSDPINLERFFPKSILMVGYYYTAHYPWNSTFSRPNGFFFLEPSFVSAFLASASVLEIAYFRRRWRAALMVAATFISMGVTGISMLVIAVPFLLLREKRQVRRPSFSSSGSRLLRSISACRLSRG
jgi:hypothetical protein